MDNKRKISIPDDAKLSKSSLALDNLKKRLRFQELITHTSTKFIHLPADEIDHVINEQLEEIGKFFNADRVAITRYSESGEVLASSHMWCSDKINREKFATILMGATYPNLIKHIKHKKYWSFSDPDDFSHWYPERETIAKTNFKSGLVIVLNFEATVVEVFVINFMHSTPVWSKEIIDQVQLLGHVFSNALNRKRAEQELNKRYHEIRLLKDKLEQENIYLQQEINVKHNVDTIIGKSASLNYVLRRLEQVASTDATVLINGETGTGKELFAHALHSTSLRKDKPLIKIGCANLPSSLVESELFGHEKGAFTGADKQRIGRFELADKGTIFLDEIGELPFELQAKLLRVLQEGEFERLGSSKTIKIDARVITATNRNLEEAVKKGSFREDLYYRLTSFVITIPPLRERLDDIPLLTKFLVDKWSKKLNKKIKTIQKSSLRNLEHYSWPGNIRELENVIQNAIIISEKSALKIETPGSISSDVRGRKKLEDIERDHIIQVLESTNWRLGGKGGAAELLGLKRTTLYAKMKKYGINRQESKY